MKDYEISYLKNKLLTEKETVIKTLKVNQEFIEDSNIKEDIGELTSYDNHPADAGSELFEKEKSYALEKHSLGYLRDIEDSLERIHDSSYGICDFCGKEIGFERLDAQPTAKLCIDCQRDEVMKPHELNEDRPVEEEVLKHPFGRTFTDDDDNVVYDGEDTWQDVQSYGSSSGPQDISTNRLIDYQNAYYGSEERIGLTDKIESIDNEDYRGQIPEED